MQDKNLKNKKTILNTPVMKQFLSIKEKYREELVLFRMGDFYETFLEDAILTSKILGIVLTKRSNGKASDVELAGFPYHSLDNYLPKLVKAGHRVAICEQVENPKLSKGIVKREVVEVVTPGTLTGDQTLNDKSNRFIGSIFSVKDKSGFAFLDPSTGEFFLGDCDSNELNNFLLKFRPHEIIVSEKATYANTQWYMEFQPFMSRIDDYMFEYDNAENNLKKHFEVKTLKGFGCDSNTLGICASGALVNHLKSNLSCPLNHVSKIAPLSKEGIMDLDGYTVRNLELFQSLLSQGIHGTLIDCLDKTKTAGGGRLLRNSIMNPSTKLDKINFRLNTVEAFVDNRRMLSSIRKSLYNTSDLQRLLGKVNQKKASPRDIYAIAETLDKIPDWQNQLSDRNNKFLLKLSNSFKDATNLVNLIKTRINEDAPAQLLQGGVIKDGFNKELDDLREILKDGKDWINSFQIRLRENLNISKLKIGFNKIFGYYIEITNVHQHKIPESFIRKQTLVNSERYITDELKNYEEKVINAEEKIFDIESRLFFQLCELIIAQKSDIQINAAVMSKLDLLSTFASLSIKNNYTKPVVIEKSELKIKGGRHPVVEQLIPATEKFIPNDIYMDVNKNQIHLLTGPNMAGKSTYLRQLGLIVIMAQIGCYVPAKKAKLGLVDKLFTRVGASDNLAGGESTFLVEMNEAANILNNATNDSLILLDEIGRGTSTYDGLSLAWAITEFIHNTEGIRARTIFATHYHELTELENTLSRLENHHVEVKEFDDSVIFLRTIAKGPGDKSYGIYVGKMAGLPREVINRATEILKYHTDRLIAGDSPIEGKLSNQLSVFQEQELRLRSALNKIEPNSMAPIDALNYLYELKKEHNL